MLKQMSYSIVSTLFCAGLITAPAQAARLTTLATFAAPQIGYPIGSLIPAGGGGWYGIEQGLSTIVAPSPTPVIFHVVKAANGTTPDQIDTLPVIAITGFSPSILQGGPKGSLFAGGQLANCQTGLGGQPAPCAVIAQLTPPTTVDGNWAEALIWKSTSEIDSVSSLVISPKGNLIVNTGSDGLFQLVPSSTQTAWTVETIADNGFYTSPVIDPGSGVIYAGFPGPDNAYSVVSVTPPTLGQTTWTQTTIYTLPASSTTETGFFPQLVVNGHLFGIVGSSTNNGGAISPVCCGSIALLTQRAANTPWNFSTLLTFTGTNGAYPNSLTVGGNGVIYGTTQAGGTGNCTLLAKGCGTVFALTADHTGKYAEKILWNFTGGTDGAEPMPIVNDHKDGLIGAAYLDGASSLGTVFKVGIPANK